MVTPETRKRGFCSVDEMREQLDEIIARVEGGETVTIVRKGKIVAEMTAAPDEQDNSERYKTPLAKVLQDDTLEPVRATLEEMMTWRREGLR